MGAEAKNNRKKIKILSVNEEGILFDNLKKITYSHYQECCESNYADFVQLEKAALKEVFEEPLYFEEVPHAGFRFGNPGKMYFAPCYSEQNGYYTTHIDIYYDNGQVICNMECEERFW